MKQKIEWVCYIGYFILCFDFLHILSQKTELSLVGIMGCCLVTMLLYLLFWNAIFAFGHLVTSIYYLLNGTGLSPVLFYPFIFGADKQKPIQLFWNFFYMCESYYPSSFFSNTHNIGIHVISDFCRNAQLVNLFAKAGLCILCGGIFFYKGYLGIGVTNVLFIIILFLSANIKTDTYHGCFVKIRYIKQGYAELYLARWAILYSDENHMLYKRFEDIIMENRQEEFQKDFEYICLETIKHMYMIKCVNQQFLYPDKMKGMIEETYFLHSLSEYKRMDIGDEKFSIMKAYLCDCILNENTSGKNILRYYLDLLVQDEKKSIVPFHTFQWYLQILDKGKLPESDAGKNTILRRNQFLESFPNYKKIYLEIENKMNGRLPTLR